MSAAGCETPGCAGHRRGKVVCLLTVCLSSSGCTRSYTIPSSPPNIRHPPPTLRCSNHPSLRGPQALSPPSLPTPSQAARRIMPTMPRLGPLMRNFHFDNFSINSGCNLYQQKQCEQSSLYFTLAGREGGQHPRKAVSHWIRIDASPPSFRLVATLFRNQVHLPVRTVHGHFTLTIKSKIIRGLSQCMCVLRHYRHWTPRNNEIACSNPARVMGVCPVFVPCTGLVPLPRSPL